MRSRHWCTSWRAASARSRPGSATTSVGDGRRIDKRAPTSKTRPRLDLIARSGLQTLSPEGDCISPGRVFEAGGPQEWIVVASIFLDFTLPNAATWFYFSFLLAHRRLLQVRPTSLAPQLGPVHAVPAGARACCSLQEAHALPGARPGGPSRSPAAVGTRDGAPADRRVRGLPATRAGTLLKIGYIWLVVGSAYFFARCIFDLGLEKRPSPDSQYEPAGAGLAGGRPVPVAVGGRGPPDAGLAAASRAAGRWR